MSKKDDIIKDFQFHVPVELVKADSEEDGAVDAWQIQGVASTAGEDLQGEIVDQNGLDITMLKAGRGLFNFDHQKGPENVIGQIEEAEFMESDGSKALFVKGYLFKHSERGKAFYNILKSLKKSDLHRVHFSIEGKILKRCLNNPKNIANARVDKVALTFDPVNPVTYCSLVKSLNAMNIISENDLTKGEVEMPAHEAVKEHKRLINVLESDDKKDDKKEAKKQKKELKEYKKEVGKVEKSITLSRKTAEKLLEIAQKALSAGAGHAGAPGDMTGGAAMMTESMDKDPKNVTYDKKKKKKKIKKSHGEEVQDLIEKARKRHPDANPIKLTQMVIESYNDQLIKEGLKNKGE